MNSNIESLEELLLEWENGTLDQDGVDQLRDILASDKDARTRFVQLQTLSAALKLEDSAGLAPNEPGIGPNERLSVQLNTQTGARPNRNFWLAAAIACFCILGGRLLFLEFGQGEHQNLAQLSPGAEQNEATSSGVALITKIVDVQWSKNQKSFEVGEAIQPGNLAFETGILQVEFFCGATVVVEGPAEIELKSSMLAQVHRGKIRAQVPPAARGFTIDLADMKVVDLGTEFALSVGPHGTDVQVFDGEVELHRPTMATRLLSTGQAVTSAEGGQLQEAQLAPSKFVDIETLDARVLGQHVDRYDRWKQWSENLRRDPSVIAYYAFDKQVRVNRKLQNNCTSTDDNMDGAVVGAKRVAGRWAAKDGLEFKQPADRVRIHIPGDYSSLTLACWAKIDSLDRRFNSLFLTDNYNQGEPHWQILNSGQIYFSVRPSKRNQPGPTDQKVLSPPFWNASMSGKWLHFAVTYDITSSQTTHYLNGEILHTEQIPPPQLAKKTRFGTASIGNWSLPTLPDEEFAVRNLNGSIDEFLLMSRALSADEILRMYDHGKP